MDDLTSRLRAQFEEQYEVQADGCWLWTGTIQNVGYGTMTIFGGRVLAHRLSYELFVGPIPPNLDIDHLCHNRACVNYEHLEAVTRQENLLRSSTTQAAKNAAKTHCPKGHPLSGDNLRVCAGKRFCRACSIESQRQGRRRRGVPEQGPPSMSPGAVRQRACRARQAALKEV